MVRFAVKVLDTSAAVVCPLILAAVIPSLRPRLPRARQVLGWPRTLRAFVSRVTGLGATAGRLLRLINPQNLLSAAASRVRRPPAAPEAGAAAKFCFATDRLDHIRPPDDAWLAQSLSLEAQGRTKEAIEAAFEAIEQMVAGPACITRVVDLCRSPEDYEFALNRTVRAIAFCTAENRASLREGLVSLQRYLHIHQRVAAALGDASTDRALVERVARDRFARIDSMLRRER